MSTEAEHQDFRKYEQSGAYHWLQMRSNLKRFNAGLAARYRISLRMLSEGLSGRSIDAVADVGCGDGYFTDQLAKMLPSSNVSGFDFSEAAIRLAEGLAQSANLKFFAGDIFRSGRKYSLITATDVIEHVPDARTFLQQCYSQLEDGGFLFLSTPIRIREYPDDAYHVQEFFFEELGRLLNEAGFSVLSHRCSHDFRFLSVYGKRYSLIGVGRIRLAKYFYNALALFVGRNVFEGHQCELPTMQYLLAVKAR